MRVVVGVSSFGDGSKAPMELLSERGIEVIKNPYKRRMTEEEIIEHLQGADGLLAGLEPLNENVFRNCPDLKAIARIGIGMDNVDKTAAEAYGIKVSNTPEEPAEAVAEMTLSALLSICRNIPWANKDVHEGIWKKRLGKSIQELKVFIIGYGNIGRVTEKLLQALGVQTMVYDKYAQEYSTCTLEEGIVGADVISLHASGKEEIITPDMFSRMKDGVIILNSARGGLINEQALYDALCSRKVFAFWGDALWEEPYEGMIRNCENAILTPHICTYTKACRENMEKKAVENLLRDLGIGE